MIKHRRIMVALGSILLGIAILFTLFALFRSDTPGEAYIGDFSTFSFNENWTVENWTVENKSQIQTVDRPTVLPAQPNDVITLENTLPDYVDNGMRLCMRTAQADVRIFIDGELRGQYTRDDIPHVNRYLPSAYVMVDLEKADAGKMIRMALTINHKAKLNTVEIGYGNNVWFEILRENITVVLAACIMILCGVLAVAIHFILRKRIRHTKSVLFLGLTMFVTGMWIISESNMRQLIFRSPSYSAVFSYLYIELIGGFVLLYFDEVRQHRNHKICAVLQTILFGQAALNTLLAFLRIVEFYNTLLLSHIWVLCALVFFFAAVISDLRSGAIKTYSSTSFGMLLFALSCTLEIIGFYFSSFHILGVYLCIGLVSLLVATLVQVVSDEVGLIESRRQDQEKMTLMTIETIASAIDAKDLYTGGHSTRVAHYAELLASAVADTYGLRDEDIRRIHYIGLLHDIGKIGIPDNILNKVEKLTDDEFELMKRHTIIGDELLSGIDAVKGLSEGVRYHHERYDGTGYPDGLAGEAIPLNARILCLADCYDAMTSSRIYRSYLSDDVVRAEIERCAGTQFDPTLAKAFCNLLDSGKITSDTVEGLETNAEGEVYKASRLVHLTSPRKKVSAGYVIQNPVFVHMIAYIVRLSEIKHRPVRVFLFTLEDTGTLPSSCAEPLKQAIRNAVSPHALSVEIAALQRLLVLFDDEAEQGDAIMRNIQDQIHGAFSVSVAEID